jgi:hypothetical protein
MRQPHGSARNAAMTPHPKSETRGGTVRGFESYGFWLGLGLGSLAGVAVSGPNFHEWSAGTSLLVTAGCAVGGGIIGFFAGPIGAGFGGGSRSGAGGDAGGSGGDGGGGGGD